MKARTRLYRTVTASLLGAWLALLVGLLVYRQWQRRAPVTEAPARTPTTDQTEQPVRVQKGFVFTYALGVSPSIRLAAKESVEFASGWLELTDVDLTFFQGGEVAYGLVAKKARFHQRTSQAVVEGDPLLSLGHGVVARAQGFSLESGEQLLRSRGPVSFAGVGWGGLAGSLSSALSEDLVTVDDGVSLVAEENGGQRVTLLAPMAQYRRKQGTVEFPKGVMLFRQSFRFEAPGGTLFLDDETGSLEKLALQGTVAVVGQTENGETVEGRWGDSQAQRQSDGTWAFVAQSSSESGWARLRVLLPGGEVRELQAWRFEGVAAQEGLQKLEGLGLACALRSRPREQPSRLSAERLVVAFAEGQAQELRANGNVVLEEAAGQASGDTLVAKLPNGPGELTADRQVEFSSRELYGVCQRIAFDEQGNFTASGGVQGTVKQQGQAQELRFAASQAKGAMASSNRVTLLGDARIWQNAQVLRADEMLLDEEAATLQARGRVLSKSAGEGQVAGTIEASQLTYMRAKGEALFSGGVRVLDQRGTIESQTLQAFLTEKGEILRGEFREHVVIREKVSGRRIFGDVAVYDGSSETLLITGQPATAEEPSGNRVQASRITWNRKTGSMDVGGDVDTPSQTLYHPEGPAKTPARRTPLPQK